VKGEIDLHKYYYEVKLDSAVKFFVQANHFYEIIFMDNFCSLKDTSGYTSGILYVSSLKKSHYMFLGDEFREHALNPR
jgi:hypothetical protein